MKPISERAFAAIVELLRGITPANDHYLKPTIYRSRRTIGQDCVPAVNVWDGGEEATDTGGRSIDIVQSVTVEIHATRDADDTGEQLGMLKADVKRALLRNRRFEDDQDSIGALSYAGTTPPANPDPGAETEWLEMRFTVTYKEGRGDPAAQARGRDT